MRTSFCKCFIQRTKAFSWSCQPSIFCKLYFKKGIILNMTIYGALWSQKCRNVAYSVLVLGLCTVGRVGQGIFPFIGAIEGPQTCITRQFARDCMKNKKGSFDYAWLEMTGLWRRSRDWCTRRRLFIKPRNWVSQRSAVNMGECTRRKFDRRTGKEKKMFCHG